MQVGVELVPFLYRGKDAHGDDFVAHLAEVLVACLEGGELLFCAGEGLCVNAVACDARSIAIITWLKRSESA